MPGAIRPEIAKERMAELDRVTSGSGAAYRKGLVGRRERVLFEREGDHTGTVRGRCDRYMEVMVEAGSSVIGEIMQVDITGAGEWFLDGIVVED